LTLRARERTGVGGAVGVGATVVEVVAAVVGAATLARTGRVPSDGAVAAKATPTAMTAAAAEAISGAGRT
jgi:hypothetical protein